MSNYKATRDDYSGGQAVDTTFTRVGGATDGTQAQNIKISTNANATFLAPYRAFPFAIWNDVTGTNVTVTVYGTINAPSLPLNDELWIECQYLGNASNTLASFKSSSKTHPLAAPASVASDGSVWDGLPPFSSLDGFNTQVVLSNGKRTVLHNVNASNGGALSTAYADAGQYYFEVAVQGTTSVNNYCGVISTNFSGTLGTPDMTNNTTSAQLGTATSVTSNGVSAVGGINLGTTVVGDNICCAFDLTARLAWFRRNGGFWNGNPSADPATGVGGVTMAPALAFAPFVRFAGPTAGLLTDQMTANFGNAAFAQTPPAGFSPWPIGYWVFKLTVNLTSPQPQQRGYVYVRVLAGKPSTTYYVDPKPVLASVGGSITGPVPLKATRDEYSGGQITETGITRTGGASAGGTLYSNKISTNANATFPAPYRMLPLAIWNDTVSANVTVTVYGTINSASLPKDDEIWLECQYLGNASSPIASFKSTAKSNPLAAGANVSSDGSSWNGGGSGAGWSPFKLTATLTSPQPQQKGYIYANVRAAKVSTIYYVDPQIVLS